jgi:UDP-N-acetyl-D-glucosamine dehydrogenase
MSDAKRLLAGIESGGVLVGIIGLGYVGLPLASALHDTGLRVLGFDIDPAKITALAEGRNYLKHLGEDMTARFAASGRFEATSDFERLDEPDAILICVPTPLGPQRQPDLSYVINSGRDIGRRLRPGQLVVLESTTYPGTTRDELLPAILEAAAGRGEFTVGQNLFVAFSPEREDPGRKSHSTRTTPKLVGGVDEKSTELAAALYSRAIETVISVESAEVAEMAKLLENIYRAVNIALVNELKPVLDEMGINIWRVIDAAATKPFGFQPFYPGPGLGGHCIPIDPFYLTWKARQYGLATRFIELAGEINHHMPEYVVSRIASALNEDAKPVKGSRILLCGVAYKPDVDDIRETPAAEIIERLGELGAEVAYHDPHVPAFPRMRRYQIDLQSVELTEAELAAADCVVVVTHHKAIDWPLIARWTRLVVDTRDVMSKLDDVRARVVLA